VLVIRKQVGADDVLSEDPSEVLDAVVDLLDVLLELVFVLEALAIGDAQQVVLLVEGRSVVLEELELKLYHMEFGDVLVDVFDFERNALFIFTLL
jgi:hypothetical protein